jgi:chaperonin GroEL (HSP60 family)
VTRTALQNAASVAYLMLTTEAMICEMVEKLEDTDRATRPVKEVRWYS